jgi:arsenate reductase
MKNILFLCVGNSCRSQMAEGWAKHLKSDMFNSYSAGTQPKDIDPRAIKAMSEVGVDISSQSSKTVEKLSETIFDIVITLCDGASEACPFLPGTFIRIHKPFLDPPFLAQNAQSEQEAMKHYRLVRDEIRDFVDGMPENLELA